METVKDTVKCRYDLSDAELQQLTQEVLSPYEDEENPRPYLCFKFDGDDKYADIGRKIELDVFLERFGNDEGLMKREYGPYEQASTFFIIFDKEKGQPAGVIRTIKNSKAGIKSLNDIQAPPLCINAANFIEQDAIDLDKCLDVGTLAVRPEFRGRNSRFIISTALYRAMYATAAAEEVKHLVAIVDERAHKNLDLLGIPFKPIMDSEPFSYLDSEKSTALYGDITNWPEIMTNYYNQLIDDSKKPGQEQLALLAQLVQELIHGSNVDQFNTFDYQRAYS